MKPQLVAPDNRVRPPARPRLLTPKEVADYLRVGVDCLAKWRWLGGGPPFIRISQNRVGYKVSDLDAWIAQRTQRSTTQEAT